MSAQDDSDSARVRRYTERWVAESPFVGEAATEERVQIHPWYQGHTPFAEGRELEEHYEPPEWSPGPATEEAEDFTSVHYEEDARGLLHEQPPEERFDPSAVPKDVADALRKKDWPLALKLAIQAGWRDENDLTNLVFFARHQELPSEKLDPTGPNFKQLSTEWTKILNEEVWKAIELSAENTDLVVSGAEVVDHHRRFLRGKSGKRLKKLVEDAAREVDLNPGLLGTIMMAETRRPQSYLSSERVSSYHIGADDFYEGRAAIKARVPAYTRVKWDKNQTPSEHLNDAKTNRRIVKTILFDSGPDAVLATAVYLKFREVRLREVAAEMKGDFDNLPLATRFALTRMAMAAGTAGATPFLKDALKGADIFVRRAIPVRAYQTQRNATVRTAQAMHLSDWIFGIPVPAAAAQPELETFEGFNEELEEFYDFDADSSSLQSRHHELDERFSLEEALSHNLAVEETLDEEDFADFEDELLLETYEPETRDLLPEEETAKGLAKKLTFLSLLPHSVEVGGKDVALTPSVMDPGIYDGPEKYKIAPKLQECLMGVMNRREFNHIKVTLVDLTKDAIKPEFAGFNHKSQVFAASVPKIAAMMAAFQLRQDLRASLKQKGSKTLDELFASVRDDWAATQATTEDKATPLTLGVSLKGKLVLVQGEKIPLGEPKAPQLESIFAGVKVGSPVTIEFQSTGESKDQLEAIIDDFNKNKKGAKEKLDALGFLERMRIMIGGLVPASNYATSTIVRDVGFLYIAATLLQSGLYDTNRKGGLWLGADYWGSKWRGPLGGGVAQSATAGSLAAFMTLLAQNRLVSPQASTDAGALMKKEPNPTHPGIVSWFNEGLKGLRDGGSRNLVLSKLGAHSGVDDCTLIEREVDLGDSKKVLRYVAVGLRAKSTGELKSLILELDKCILANNGLTPVQGGHS